MMKLLTVASYVCAVTSVLTENNTENGKTTLVIRDPPPGQSTHRLISTMVDPLDNSSHSFSPGNITDTSPFLPSGVVQGYGSSPSFQEEKPSQSVRKDFTPSYFMGEVIPEPYVPERFQSLRSISDRNSLSGSNQGLVSSQTISFPKLLPRNEQKTQKSPSYGRGAGDMHSSEPSSGSYFQGHASPVYEPSADGEHSTTPKYSPKYEESDQQTSTPIDIPYKFESGFQHMQSTKPVTFKDDHSKHQKPLSLDFEENRGYFHPYKYKTHSENFDEPFTSQPDYYNSHYGGPEDDGRNSIFANMFSGTKDQTKPSYNSYPRYEDYVSSRPEADLVLPSPFYPSGPEHPTSHHKGSYYSVHQHKPKSAIHGLLHFAAALLPLGLFVAALQPNVLHVNSSQPMPGKGRSVDALETPGLEVLERLEGDCERRAFCELAVLGSRPDSSAAQRGLWLLADGLAKDHVKSVELSRVLTAVKSKSCSVLKCDNPPRTRRL